jgi:hypothetical protein
MLASLWVSVVFNDQNLNLVVKKHDCWTHVVLTGKTIDKGAHAQ